MRGIFLNTLFILSTYVPSVWSDEPAQCASTRSELLLIESNLMSQPLSNCDASKGITKNCCDTSIPNSPLCKNLRTATEDYNEAVAELIILEGLISIGASISKDSLALKQIDEEKIETVKATSKSFLNNFEKAKIINFALTDGVYKPTIEQGQTQSDILKPILSDYKGPTSPADPNNPHKELAEYLDEKCGVSSEHTFKEFCDEYKVLKSDKTKNLNGALETLEGLHQNLKELGDVAKEKYYQKIKNNLTLYKVEGDNTSALDYNSDSVKAMVAKIEKMNKIASNKNIDKQALLELSEDLTQVKTRYGISGNVSEKDVNSKILAPIIDGTIETLQSMNSHLLGIDKNAEKLTSMSGQIDDITKSSLTELNRELLKSYPDCEEFNNQEIKTRINKCLEKKEQSSSKNSDSLGVTAFKEKLKKIDKYSQKSNLLNELTNCYKKPTLPAIELCQKELLKRNSDVTNTELLKARKKVSSTKQIMDSYFEGEPINFLQLNKMHAYQKFTDLGCNNQTNNYELQGSYCKSSEIDGLTLSNATLGTMENILLNLKDDAFKKMLEEKYGKDYTSAYKKYREDVLSKCPEENSYCQSLSKEIGQERKIQQEEQQAYIIRYEDQKKKELAIQKRLKEERREDRSRSFNAAMSGLAQVAVTGAPQIMQAHIETQNVKSMTENYRQSVIYQQKYQNWLNQQQQYYGNLYSQSPYMNYGWGFYNSNNASSFNYPNNNYTFYQHGTNQFNFSQFNFLPMSYADMATPATSISTGGSYTGTTTGTMTTTTTGDFGFSF